MSVLDSARRRVFIAPLGLYLTLDSGQFASVDYDASRKTVAIHLTAATVHVPAARLRIAETDQRKSTAIFEASGRKLDDGAYLVPLDAHETVVTVHAR